MVINMKIGITGSRDFLRLEIVDSKLDEILKWFEDKEPESDSDFTPLIIITGGARGVDQQAMAWCLRHPEVEQITIRPISTFNKVNYLFRNVEIVTMSDHIIAFWNGTSRGTKFTMDYANARGKKVLVIRDD